MTIKKRINRGKKGDPLTIRLTGVAELHLTHLSKALGYSRSELIEELIEAEYKRAVKTYPDEMRAATKGNLTGKKRR